MTSLWHLSWQHDGSDITIDIEKVIDTYRVIEEGHDITIVEGAGGLLVPFTDGLTFADFAKRLQLPTLVVVASRLGAINHAMLTVRHIESMGTPFLGYVINHILPSQDLAGTTNVEMLSEWIGPPLGIIPRLQGELSRDPAMRQQLLEVFASQAWIEERL